MIHKLLSSNHQTEITKLFTHVFSSSEGTEEGQLVGNLAAELASAIDDKDIICFGTYEQDILIGAIFFTRLYFKQSVAVYMLAPVAVHTEYQQKGVGQSLISHGLSELKKRAVEVVITYGDPAYYSKVGFTPLSEDTIRAPLTLSMPIGWQGQSLTGMAIPVINERPACVAAFNNPVYW